MVDGSEKVLTETSDAVEDRCYALRSRTCRTQGFAGSGAHRGGCRDVLARVCWGTVEVHSVRVGQRHPDPIHG